MVKGGHQAGSWLGGQDFGSQLDDCKTPMLHGLAVSGSCTRLVDRPLEAGSSGNPLTSQPETNGSAGDSGRRSAERKSGTGASASRSVRMVTYKCFPKRPDRLRQHELEHLDLFWTGDSC